MDESALQRRLDRMERRQSIVLTLLVGIYLIGGLWFLVQAFADVTVWHAVVVGVVLAIVASGVGIYRRRGARA